eukprot:1188843-Prorocentrum_minimum.AAC.6
MKDNIRGISGLVGLVCRINVRGRSPGGPAEPPPQPPFANARAHLGEGSCTCQQRGQVFESRFKRSNSNLFNSPPNREPVTTKQLAMPDTRSQIHLGWGLRTTP